MTSVPIKIIRFTDESQPGWVECELIDAAGRHHAFVEKIPVVTQEELWRDSDYPREGSIACEVVAMWIDEGGRSLTKIDSSKPWGIESKDGVTEFVVMSAILSSDANGPIQPPQRNAGSRPFSSDSPASETPSSLGPRG